MNTSARVFLGCFAPAIALGANEPNVGSGPPSSAEAPGETARLAFDHREQRARRCDDDYETCWPVFASLPQVSELRLTIVPIPEPRLGRRDERRSKQVVIPAGRTPGRASVGLAPGEWELRVSEGRARRLRLRDGETVTTRIWTLFGWCVGDGRRCLLQPGVVRRWIQPPQPTRR